MLSPVRALLLGAAALPWLVGCGVSSYGTQSGSSTSATSGTTGTSNTGGKVGGLPGGGDNGVSGAHNTVVMTPPAALVKGVVGSKLSVPITFTSSDGRTITAFALSSASAFPAGWTAPASFACATVSTGSSCVLNLTYLPTAYTMPPQTLTLNYVFVDNANEPVTVASASFQYQATTNDTVSATVSPVGQINATVAMGSQSVTATFASSDGKPAANLSVTSTVPATLPGDWTGPATPSCATVSAGMVCALTWTYTPTVPASGMITVNFAYDNDSGTAKTGSFNFGYRATADDTIQPAPAPVSVMSGQTQVVTIPFVTDDGFAASNLTVTSPLPPTNTYWSSGGVTSFSCATVSAGTPCVLSLTYAPTVSGDSGVVTVNYSYTNNAGVAKTGTFNINYTST